MTEPLFIVSKEDWSLHRKGYQDQTRHQEKVKDAIKQNLPDLVTDESIVMSNGKQVVKVPIKSLDEYRFRYNEASLECTDYCDDGYLRFHGYFRSN